MKKLPESRKEKQARKRAEQSKRDKEQMMLPWFPLMDQIIAKLGVEDGIRAYQMLTSKECNVEECAERLGISKNEVQRLQLARLAEGAPAGFLEYYSAQKELDRAREDESFPGGLQGARG